MKLREEILKEHSKTQCSKIVKWIGGSQARFDELFKLFLNDEYRVVQRAAWPVSYAVMAHPEFIQKHFSSLIRNLKKPHLHDAVKRNSVRLLQAVDIPEKYEGAIMDICFQYIQSASEAVAVKAFSMTVLGRLAIKYPDIIPEIKMIIEDQWPNQTPAFRSSAAKLLKHFQKHKL